MACTPQKVWWWMWSFAAGSLASSTTVSGSSCIMNLWRYVCQSDRRTSQGTGMQIQYQDLLTRRNNVSSVTLGEEGKMCKVKILFHASRVPSRHPLSEYYSLPAGSFGWGHTTADPLDSAESRSIPAYALHQNAECALQHLRWTRSSLHSCEWEPKLAKGRQRRSTRLGVKEKNPIENWITKKATSVSIYRQVSGRRCQWLRAVFTRMPWGLIYPALKWECLGQGKEEAIESGTRQKIRERARIRGRQIGSTRRNWFVGKCLQGRYPRSGWSDYEDEVRPDHGEKMETLGLAAAKMAEW